MQHLWTKVQNTSQLQAKGCFTLILGYVVFANPLARSPG